MLWSIQNYCENNQIRFYEYSHFSGKNIKQIYSVSYEQIKPKSTQKININNPVIQRSMIIIHSKEVDLKISYCRLFQTICDNFSLIIAHIQLYFMRQSKTPIFEKLQPDNLLNTSSEQSKIATICLKNAIEGILKRLQSQAICKIIINSAQHSQKVGALKFLSFFGNNHIKRKTQMVFERLRQSKYLSLIKNKAAILLAFYYRRIVKNELKTVIYRFRSLKFQPKSLIRKISTRKSVGQIPSPRMSQQSQRSNLLAISEDSISQGNDQQYEDRRHYGNSNINEIITQSQQFRKMELSQHFRELLHKLQRFDRQKNSQSMINTLKKPIQDELRRLQRVKRQNKDGKSKVHDNQLLLACMLNQIKLFVEQNVEQSFLNLKNVKHSQQIIQLQPSSQNKRRETQYFSNEEITTLNIITAVLRARQYKDIKRQIEFFIKKSNKKEINSLLKQVAIAFDDFCSIQQSSKSKDKNKTQLNNTIGLLDKHLRTEKYDQVQKLKNKLKNSVQFYQLNALIETIFSMNNELKKYKKKESQVERGFTSPTKQKNIQQQNENLKQQLKSLQLRFRELEGQNQKLKDAMKKNVDRVHPSLLPKKTGDKEPITVPGFKAEDMFRKYKQLEANMQKKLQSLSKQTSAKLQKAKHDSKKLQQKIKELQFQLENSQSHSKSMLLKVKQKDDFLSVYQNISKKMIEKESFIRDVNEFKKKYPESKFLSIIQKITVEQTIRNSLAQQLKNIVTAFDDNSWKRKQNNLLLKTEGQIYTSINALIQKILRLLKQKQEIKGSQKLSQSGKKNEEKLQVQNMSLKEQVERLKIEMEQSREQIEKIKSEKIKTQNNQSNSKTKASENFNRSSVDKQVTDLRSENQKLKKQLEETTKSTTSTQNALKYENIKKQIQQGVKMYEVIRAKRLKNQAFSKELNEFRRNNPKSFLAQIFQNIAKEETLKTLIVNQLKNIVSSFNDNTWKKRQNNLLLKQESELNLQINNLINLLISSAKSLDQSKYTTLTTQLKNIKNILSDNTWKRRLNSLVVKDQSELHTAVSQIIQFTINQMNEKEQLSKNKNQCEQLREKIVKYQKQIGNLRQQKNKIKSQQKSIRPSSTDNNQKLKLQREIKTYKNQHEQLRFKFQETLKKQAVIQSTVNQLLLKATQFQDLIQLYQIIKSKKMLGQTSIKEVNQYKKKYASSSSLELVDVMYTNVIQEYNKNAKDIPTRKNTQLVSFEEKQKELEMQKLREQNTRLKSQFKTRPESPETKEKLNIERQKTLIQMREINELKLQIDKIKLENQRIKEQLTNAVKTNADLHHELDTVHEQLSQSRKQAAKKKEIESTKLMQSLNKKLLQLQNLKIEWQKRESSYISELKLKQQKIKDLQKALFDSQLLQIQLEEKVENYKMLYDKVKKERNNFILLLEQKNQQFEITKENQQLYLKEREQKEDKIIQLKHRFEETAVDIKQIQGQIQKVLIEKERMEKNLNDKIAEQEKEITKLKGFLDEREKMMSQVQKKYELDFSNLRNQIVIENNKLNLNIQSVPEIAQSAKIPLKKIYQDLEKVQLRKQLEMVNQEMATFVRNSENQKRQMRQYMEKLSSQMQMQNVLHNEEKKMLREDIERARNQQYQINQEKLNRLRADIQGLRIENERLTSIIDHNQSAFHQLINQHQQMSLKIQQMEEFNQSLNEQNSQLTSDLYTAGQQKLELALKLQPLEDKLTELQNQISLALQQKKASQLQMFRSSQAKQNALQSTITKLTNQNRLLQTRISTQAKSMLELHQNLLRLQCQLNQYRQEGREIKNGQYSNYLQQKLRQQSEEVQRLIANQNRLVYKIEQLIKNVNELQKQRVQLLSQKRQIDYSLTIKNVSNSEYLPLQQKLAKLQQTIIQKEQQISFWKKQSSIMINQTETQLKLKQLQQQLRYYQHQAAKYKTTVELKSKEIAELQAKAQQNIKLNIQLKHLNQKYKTLTQDCKQIQQRYQSYQKEVMQLKKQKSVLLITHSSQNSLENIKQSRVYRQEEFTSLKSQILAKDQQIQRLRQSLFDLDNKTRAYHEKVAECQRYEVNYRQLYAKYEQTKRQVIDLEFLNQNLQNQLQMSKNNEKQAIDNQGSMRVRLEEMLRQNQVLQRQNRQLIQSNQAKRNYIGVLREILLQLNEQYAFQNNEEELELKILQQISQQITQLLRQNNKLKQKCTYIESNIYFKTTDEPKQDLISSLQKLTYDLIKYLQHQQLINPEDFNMNLKHLLKQSTNNSQLYLQNLTNFIKNVISSINKDSLSLLMLYSNKIDLIKDRFDLYVRINNVDSFNQLKLAIQSSLRV